MPDPKDVVLLRQVAHEAILYHWYMGASRQYLAMLGRSWGAMGQMLGQERA